MHIEELADKIAREVTNLLRVAPKPILADAIVSYTSMVMGKYAREILETCHNNADLDQLETEITSLFDELIPNIDFGIPSN